MKSNISMKFKDVTKIKNEIVRLLDNDQEIKRYCKYMTNTPLYNKGMDKEETMVKQPDISESLVEKNIIPYRFMEEVLDDLNTLIFVYFDNADLSKGTLGDYIFAIDIFVPKQYDILKELGQERNIEIATKIADLLDDKPISGIDNKYFKSEILKANQTRLNKESAYNVMSLDLRVKILNTRVSVSR